MVLGCHSSPYSFVHHLITQCLMNLYKQRSYVSEVDKFKPHLSGVVNFVGRSHINVACC